MAISVDYSVTPWLITIPQSDLTLVSGTEYQITVDYLWQLLRDYADSAESLPYPRIYTRIAATSSTPAIVNINENYYQAQFQNGSYSVEIIGGNSNFRTVEKKNTVSVGTNNTTGFIDPTFLEAGLFMGSVVIDVVNGVANTATGKTPDGGIIGTRRTPVNNIDDAVAIAKTQGVTTFTLASSLTIIDTDLSAGYTFIGDSPYYVLSCQAAANMTGCRIEMLTVNGELDGLNLLRDCAIIDISRVSGFIEKCAFSSDVVLSGHAYIFESYSMVPGAGYPSIYAEGNNIVLRDYSGSMAIENFTAGDASLGLKEGRLILQSTCTGGSIFLRGTPYSVLDNSTGTTVTNQTDSEKMTDVWQIHGLDKNNAMTVTPSSRNAGGVSQVITGDGSTSSTVTRS